ncbi:MAG TPA: FGGY family carbohydrate kinase [Gallionella sp.]
MSTSRYSAIALDLGTTSVKAGLLDRDGVLSRVISHPAPTISVNGRRYESDALAYFNTAEQVLHECVADAQDCRILGLCSQRSSFLIWERGSGRPVTPLISWQDTRGESSCDELRPDGSRIRELAGLPLTPYYFAPKLHHVLREDPDLLPRLERGELMVGMLDTFLVWRWSRGLHFITDTSMAARTLLMDIRSQQWSPVLCELFGIPARILPRIGLSEAIDIRLDNGLTLRASLGDQSAALYAGIAEDGKEAIANLGTGCFVERYLPAGKVASEGYLHTLVYQDRARQMHFAIEGTLNSIAAALAPYPVGECRIEELGEGDIYCLAEPGGLGAPYFRGDIGLAFSQPVGHLSQRDVAVLLLEAVIFRVTRILEEFHRDAMLERVYLSGGLAELVILQQGIARCVPLEVYRLRQGESSLLGAGMMAAGMPPASSRDAGQIEVAGAPGALLSKYRRWSAWFDDLLSQKQPAS